MLLTLLLLPGWAADCPDPASLLQSAEQDTVAYYLADADESVASAVEAFGCGGLAAPEDLAHLFLVKGMIWRLQEQPEKSARGFAAARMADESLWIEDFGGEAQAAWEASVPPEGKGAAMRLRGLGDDDWVAVDGVKVEPKESLEPGLHLVQVGAGEVAHWSRVVDVEAGAGELVLAVAATPAVAAPVPVAQPQPATPVPAGPVNAVASVLQAPVERVKGTKFQDAGQTPLKFKADLFDVARFDPKGVALRKDYKKNRTAQWLVGGGAAVSAYSFYLFAWDASVGHNSGAGAWIAMPLSAAATAGFASWEYKLHKKRRAIQDDIASTVNGVLEARDAQ